MSDDYSDHTQQLHHLVEEGADLPTVLTARPDHTGARRGYSVSSRQQRVTLGRGSRCDVVIDDDRVSRLHAVVRLMGTRAVLEDAGSTNGTYVDGVRVQGPVELNEGAMVRFGRRGPVFRYGRNLGRASGEDDAIRPPGFG